MKQNHPAIVVETMAYERTLVEELKEVLLLIAYRRQRAVYFF